ncbi:MAG: ATP-binding cassette domain-containing protein [Bradyrhizobiaceae bacterium]|nr:MAG: ATP-binding cassette domain-containing protein [Bradyrhizobiaceae bacterium]
MPDVGGPAQPLLTVSGLVKSFPGRGGLFGGASGRVHAVNDISFEVRKGETLGVVGESGCGKSTTSKLIMGLTEPTAGDILFDGEIVKRDAASLRHYRRQVQMVFQDSFSSLNPRLTVQESIAFPAIVHGASKRDGLAIARDMLAAVGLQPAQYATRFPHELSGGQRQRVNIARALGLRPRLVVLDEPVSALDKSVEAQVLNLLIDLKREFGLTYIFISHDLNVVQYISDRLLVMYLGSIVEIGDSAKIFEDAAHPYTAALFKSRPSIDGRAREIAPLSGDPPSPINLPKGCRFHPRCAFAKKICTEVLPELKPVDDGHYSACLKNQADSGYAASGDLN